MRSAARSARRSTDGPLTREELVDRGRRAARAPSCRRSAPLRLGDAAEAARLAGRPLLRAEPGDARDVHASGVRELRAGRRSPIRTRRRRSPSSPTSAPTGRRRSTPSATGWPAAGSASDSSGPGSARSATGWPRSTSTASAPTSSPRTSTSCVATTPTTAVRLLPGFDQYVLGPGHRRRPRRAGAATRGGEPAERLDLAGRRRRRRRVRHLGARRRPARSRGSRRPASRRGRRWGPRSHGSRRSRPRPRGPRQLLPKAEHLRRQPSPLPNV